jgi:hypothetical protein
VLLGAKAGILILAWNHPGAAITVLMLLLKNGPDLKLILGKQDNCYTPSFRVHTVQVSTFFFCPHGSYHACFGKDFLEKLRIRCNFFLERLEVLNKIGVNGVGICSVGTEDLQKTGVADAHGLREPAATDGERLRDAQNDAHFPCHAVCPHLHHQLKEGTTPQLSDQKLSLAQQESRKRLQFRD